MEKWLLAIVPPLIAGLFVLAPDLVQQIILNKDPLRYNISTSPYLEKDKKKQVIISVEIRNNGSQPQRNLLAQARFPDADQIVASITPSTMQNTLTINGQDTNTVVPTLLGGDHVSIIYFVQYAGDLKPEFRIASDTLLAKSGSENESLPRIVLLIIAFAAAVAVGGAFWTLQKKRRQHVTGTGRVWFAPNAIIYICSVNRLPEVIELCWRVGGQLSYYAAADYIVSLRNLDRLSGPLGALVMLFLIRDISKDTLYAIETMLSLIIGGKINEEQRGFLDTLRSESEKLENFWDFRSACIRYHEDILHNFKPSRQS